MGLDYGSKTVGVALSDPLGITAQGVETICRKDENKLRKTCARIEALIEEYQVTKIVLVPHNDLKAGPSSDHLTKLHRFFRPISNIIVHMLRKSQHNKRDIIFPDKLLNARKCLTELILFLPANNLHPLGSEHKRVADCNAHCLRSIIQT